MKVIILLLLNNGTVTQSQRTTMEVNPRTLTLSNALEARQSPSDDKCAICQELLKDLPPIYSPADRYTSNTDRKAEMDAVITKVCGDKHFFHRVCIESWWKSASPHLNTCPIDRTLCYGNVRVGQADDNIPEYATFLGHNSHAHDFVYPESFIGQIMAHYAERTHMQFPAYLLAQHGDVEEHGHDAVNPSSNALPGRTAEELQALSTDDTDLFITHARDEASNSLNQDQITSLNPLVDGLPGRAIEDVQAPFASDRDLSDLIPEGMEEIGAQHANNDTRRRSQPGRNDPLADSIARGLLPAPRVAPFSVEAEPEAYHDLDGSAHLVGFFENEDDIFGGCGAGAGSLHESVDDGAAEYM
jgi:hypothetical protein